MRLSAANNTALGIGAIVVIVLTLLFYLDITRKTGAGRGEMIGTITYKIKESQRKYASQVIWEDLERESPVYNNDTIRTAGLSEAVIKLKDGTEIALTENSMVLLSLSRNNLNLDFTRGSIVARREGITDSSIKSINIKASDTMVSLDKGNLSMSNAGGKNINLAINSGNARIKSGDSVQELGVNQKVAISGDKVYDLKLQLRNPAANSVFYAKRQNEPVNFTWDQVAREYTVFLEISRDNTFTALIAGIRVDGNEKSVVVPEGIYYCRLRAVNVKTGTREYSEVRWFRVMREKPVQLISPANNTVMVFRINPPIINFLWSAGDTDSSYRLMVSTEPEMGKKLLTRQLTDPRISVDTLGEGNYYWQVETIIGTGAESRKVLSPVYKFAVAKNRFLASPELLYPPDNKMIVGAMLKNQELTFTWKKKPEIPESRLAISKDPDFKETVFTEKSKNNIIKFRKMLDSGTYYWRVTGISQEEEITAPSSQRKINIVPTGEIALLAPSPEEVIVPDEEHDDAKVLFRWMRTDVKGKFKVQLSQQRDFAQVMKEMQTSGFSIDIEKIAKGDYYWHVFLFDETTGDIIMRSDARKLSVKGMLPSPVIIEPANGYVMNMIDKTRLPLRWEAAEGANRYRIEIYRLDHGKRQKLTTGTTAANEYIFDDMEKLDVGKFILNLQAQEMKGGKILRRSGTAVSIFEITLGEGGKKPKILSPKVLFIE